jgi:hypothetical protein
MEAQPVSPTPCQVRQAQVLVRILNNHTSTDYHMAHVPVPNPVCKHEQTSGLRLCRVHAPLIRDTLVS